MAEFWAEIAYAAILVTGSGFIGWAIGSDFGRLWRGLEDWPPETRHGTAAALLHGQPFGFTREDVQAIRDACEAIDSEWGPYSDDPGDMMHYHGTGAAIPRLRSLADRIEALLSPEPSTP